MNFDNRRLPAFRSRLQAAEALFRAGRLNEAVAALLAVDREFGAHHMTHYLLGACYLTLRDGVAAKPHLTECLRLHPTWPAAWSAMSLGFAMLGWVEEAVSANRRSVLLEPGNLETCKNFIKVATVRGGLADVQGLAGRLPRLDPKGQYNWRGMILAAGCAGAASTPALSRAARIAILEDPLDGRMYSELGGHALALDALDAADRASARARILGPDDELGLLSRLAILARRGQVGAFLALCCQGLDKAMESPAILNAILAQAEVMSDGAMPVDDAEREAVSEPALRTILDLAHDAIHLGRFDDARALLSLIRHALPANTRAIGLETLLGRAERGGLPRPAVVEDIKTPRRYAIIDECSSGASLYASVNVHETLDQIHDLVRPSVYFEVGLGKGDALLLSRPTSHAIGIDPRPLRGLFEAHPHISFFQGTSDAFFDNPANLERHGCRDVDMAFIDGMHLFEYALRDFRNTERLMRPEGVIFLHDLLPPYGHWAGRDNVIGYPWAGDVWKVFRILARYRPDLDLAVLLAEPTGIGMVRCLDPSNTTLWEREAEIIASVKTDRFDFQELWNQSGPPKLALGGETRREDLRRHLAL